MSATRSSRFRRSVFLIGFMASGKTAVGRALAGMLDLPFVDLDDEIETAAGRRIPEIFADEGEEHFRRLERAALHEVASGPAVVVATGGGAPCHAGGLDLMRERGLVVALSAPLEALLSRAADSADRPLLHRSRQEVRVLYEQRSAVYRQAHVGIETEGRTPGEVAHVARDLVLRTQSIPQYALIDAAIVSVGERSYPVMAAPGSLDRLGELARRSLGGKRLRLGLVSDTNVAPLYGGRARAALEEEGFEVSLSTVPAGERAKGIEGFARLSEELVAAGLDRSSAIVALGGGVVGDLAGFVAATLYRGIGVIQVPTTLLAMVDAAIGGKTGINIGAGKNLIGAFLQPVFVLADPEVLSTLPVRERRAAFGELVKYALLDGEELYGLVDQLAPALGRSSPTATGGSDETQGASPPAQPVREIPSELTAVIRRCAAIKSWIVSRDEREQTGERALLNLGHTVGHAIEAASGYGPVLHGEAVALGLVASCRASARLGLCPEALEARVKATLERAGLDADLDAWLTGRELSDRAAGGPPRDVLSHIGVDKKRTAGGIGFVAIRDVGDPVCIELRLEELARILHP